MYVAHKKLVSRRVAMWLSSFLPLNYPRIDIE
jgi:hypothetical protein